MVLLQKTPNCQVNPPGSRMSEQVSSRMLLSGQFTPSLQNLLTIGYPQVLSSVYERHSKAGPTLFAPLGAVNDDIDRFPLSQAEI